MPTTNKRYQSFNLRLIYQPIGSGYGVSGLSKKSSHWFTRNDDLKLSKRFGLHITILLNATTSFTLLGWFIVPIAFASRLCVDVSLLTCEPLIIRLNIHSPYLHCADQICFTLMKLGHGQVRRKLDKDTAISRCISTTLVSTV